VGARFSALVQNVPGGKPSLLYNGYRVFLVGLSGYLVPRFKKEWSYTFTSPLSHLFLFQGELQIYFVFYLRIGTQIDITNF
jgi:hypothetical protein